jgi:PAS domain S-box-containing protein
MQKLDQTEKTLDECQRQFKHVCEHIAEGLLIADGAGKCSRANAQFCEAAGLKDDQFIGRRWQDVLAPIAGGEAVGLLDAKLETEPSVDLPGVTLTATSGVTQLVDIKATSITIDGEPFGTVFEFGRACAAVEPKLPTSASSEGRGLVCLYDCATGRIIHCNPECEEFYGIPSEELTELDRNETKSLVHPDDVQSIDRIQAIDSDIADGEAAEFSYRALREDGSWIPLATRCAVVEWNVDGSPKLVLGVSRPDRIEG